MDCIFSLNERVVGKDVERLRQHNDAFVNVRDTLTPAQILDVCAGFGFATASVLKEDGNRAGVNVTGIRVAQLDFDNTWAVAEATEHPLYLDYAIGLYSTASHGKEQEDLPDSKTATMSDAQAAAIRSRVGKPMERFRLVFALSEQLPSAQMSAFYAGLFAEFPMADTSCKDMARLFFGSKDAAIRIDNPVARRIEPDKVEALIATGQSSQPTLVSHLRKTQAMQVTTEGGRPAMSRGAVEKFRQNLIVVLADGEVTTCKDLRNQMKPGYENRLACFSPFRQERSPSAFVKRDMVGRLYFYDSTARKTYAFE